MGLFSFFGSPKNVSPTEFREKVRMALRRKGLSERDVDHVAQVVELGLKESGSQRGLDARELEEVIKILKKNRDAHSLSSTQIDTVEAVLTEYMGS
jgi:response regulator of citrate/malate metabolism